MGGFRCRNIIALFGTILSILTNYQSRSNLTIIKLLLRYEVVVVVGL